MQMKVSTDQSDFCSARDDGVPELIVSCMLLCET